MINTNNIQLVLVVYWELLDPNLTITADLYSNQLDRLREALVRNRPSLVNRKGVILHHDNAKPHTAKQTQQKIKELGWEVMPHPPYSLDIVPSDYHLLLSLSDHLMGKRFQNEEVKEDITSFIASKPHDFFEKGIKKFFNRWQTVVDNEGQYIVD